MKAKNVRGFLIEKKKGNYDECDYYGNLDEAKDLGRNQAINKQGNREITLNREKATDIAVDAMNKEQLRNGITQPVHKYSKCCSCGRCHTALIIVEALIAAEADIIESPTKDGK